MRHITSDDCQRQIQRPDSGWQKLVETQDAWVRKVLRAQAKKGERQLREYGSGFYHAIAEKGGKLVK